MLVRPTLALMLLTACAREAPEPVTPSASHARFEPAPMPSVMPPRRGGPVGSLEIPIPPKMPLGTGAVPVGSGPVRGSIVTGVHQSF